MNVNHDAVRCLPGELRRLACARLVAAGVPEGEADGCAELMVRANRDGNFTHGLELLPRLLQRIADGHVVPGAPLTLSRSHGAFEQWDGGFGIGPMNARRCMARAIELAKSTGLGCVALRHTNHWFRAGNFGWQAVEAGVVGVCWTNTVPLMPTWGGDHKVLGNNPLVLALPTADGGVVLDMAMSQFSMGALQRYARQGDALPVQGGTDAQGAMTSDPDAIINGGLPLPAGMWKGVGLAMMLDLLAAALSEGRSTVDMADDGVERGVSQVFLCIDPGDDALGARAATLLASIMDLSAKRNLRYPGSEVQAARAEADTQGIPVRRDLWDLLNGA